jgi:WD40 repeat protein
VATSAIDGVVRIWDRRSLALVREFRLDRGTARNVIFDPTGRLVAASGWWRVIVLSLDDGTTRDLASSAGAWDLAFSPDGRYLATVEERPGRLTLWDLAADARRAYWSAHADRVSGLALADQGRAAVTGSFDGRVRAWSIDGRTVTDLAALGPRVRAVAVSPSGDLVAAAGTTRDIVVAERAGGRRVTTLAAPSGSAVVEFKDEDDLYAGEEDGALVSWRVRERREQWRVASGDGEVLALLSWPGRVAVAHRRWSVAVRDAGGRQLARLDTRTAPFSLARSPDGRWLAVGTWDGR